MDSRPVNNRLSIKLFVVQPQGHEKRSMICSPVPSGELTPVSSNAQKTPRLTTNSHQGFNAVGCPKTQELDISAHPIIDARTYPFHTHSRLALSKSIWRSMALVILPLETMCNAGILLEIAQQIVAP